MKKVAFFRPIPVKFGVSIDYGQLNSACRGWDNSQPVCNLISTDAFPLRLSELTSSSKAHLKVFLNYLVTSWEVYKLFSYLLGDYY